MHIFRVRPILGFLVLVSSVMGSSTIDQSAVLAQARQSAGNQIRLNGKTYPGYWFQSVQGNSATVAISDGDLADDFGIDLLDTSDPQRQAVQWYSPNGITLGAQFPANGAIRYLDISALQSQFGWQVQPQGNVLVVNAGSAKVNSIKTGMQSWGRRIVVGLDRPAPWRLTDLTYSRSGKTDRTFSLAVDGTLSPAAIQSLNRKAGGGLKSLSVAPSGRQTVIKGTFAGSMRPEIWTLSNPSRLVIDIRPSPMRNRDIAWAPGIRWREGTIPLGTQQFPVTWTEINPKQAGLKIQPIWGNQPRQIVGIHPLASTALRSQSAVAINAGFFDRKRQTPLGAIRHNGTWISSPILNRGVVAWNDSGQFAMGRLSLKEIVKTSSGQTLTIVSRDSGYPQRGIARYTPTWGAFYTPILETETIVTTINNQVVSQVSSKSSPRFPIPRNGSLLVLRSFNAGTALAQGTRLTSDFSANPSVFSQYKNILGAGPLLVSNNRVVLNVAAESFQRSFEAAAAPRSAIAQKADGTLLFVAAHNRVGGAGPTLSEWARILQQMGSVNALNLDGGSSTTLFLGGRLIDRHPKTAARVQNALGVFLNSAPAP